MLSHKEQQSATPNDPVWSAVWTAIPHFSALSQAATTIRQWLKDPGAKTATVELVRQIVLHEHSIEKRLQTLLGNKKS